MYVDEVHWREGRGGVYITDGIEMWAGETCGWSVDGDYRI